LPPNKVRYATDNRLFRENLTNSGLLFLTFFGRAATYGPSAATVRLIYKSTSPVGLAIIIIIIIITLLM
jgi:hypothetical protein